MESIPKNRAEIQDIPESMPLPKEAYVANLEIFKKCLRYTKVYELHADKIIDDLKDDIFLQFDPKTKKQRLVVKTSRFLNVLQPSEYTAIKAESQNREHTLIFFKLSNPPGSPEARKALRVIFAADLNTNRIILLTAYKKGNDAAVDVDQGQVIRAWKEYEARVQNTVLQKPLTFEEITQIISDACSKTDEEIAEIVNHAWFESSKNLIDKFREQQLILTMVEKDVNKLTAEKEQLENELLAEYERNENLTQQVEKHSRENMELRRTLGGLKNASEQMTKILEEKRILEEKNAAQERANSALQKKLKKYENLICNYQDEVREVTTRLLEAPLMNESIQGEGTEVIASQVEEKPQSAALEVEKPKEDTSSFGKVTYVVPYVPSTTKATTYSWGYNRAQRRQNKNSGK